MTFNRPDYLAAQAVIFEGRVTCPNCGGKGIGRVPGWREPTVTCPLCEAEMRSPFTGLTTVTAVEADVWIADTPDADEQAVVEDGYVVTECGETIPLDDEKTVIVPGELYDILRDMADPIGAMRAAIKVQCGRDSAR